MLANCGVLRWPTVRKDRNCTAVPLANESFANKGPTVAQTLAAQILLESDVAR